MALSDMTRPRMAWSARNCSVALLVATNAMLAAPIGTSNAIAQASLGESATVTIPYTLTGDVAKFDVAADGSLSGKTTFATGATVADSMCVDAGGNVYVATQFNETDFEATDTKNIKTAITLQASPGPDGVHVLVMNTGAGHSFPTGVTDIREVSSRAARHPVRNETRCDSNHPEASVNNCSRGTCRRRYSLLNGGR